MTRQRRTTGADHRGKARPPEVGADCMRRPAAALRRTAVAASAVIGLVGGAAVLAAPAASASPVSVTGASFTWGLDDTANAGAYYGGCNFLSAGTAGDTGSSTLWTQTSPSPGYSTQSGNVTIEAPNASGVYSQPTWATRCDDPSGNPLTTSTYSGGEVAFSNGTGTVDPSTGTASITWTGSFTSVFYGGLVYWTATNPTLTVNADGTGTLTATLSGYGADMNDPSVWNTLPPTTATLANLSGVTLGTTGFTVTPDYVGLAITTPAGDTPQAAETTGTGGNSAYWGSWPQDFVNFQQETGESSYWYTSGLNDQAKVPSPLTVSYTTSTTPPPDSAPTITGQPADHTVTAGDDATFTAAATGTPTPAVQWQFEAPGATGWTALPGATSTSYTVTDTAVGDSGTAYEAIFSNSAGSVTSDPATLTVNPASPPSTYTPAVTIDDASVTVGGTLSYSATGFAPDETVDVEIDPGSTELTAATTDSDGTLSGSQALPSSVTAGSYQLTLTGETSNATASASFAVTAAASCSLANGVQGGSLTWGFKESFRAYVANGGSGNSITATDGATILDQDLAVAGDANSGTYLWPFVSSSSYTSPSDFTVQYGGQLEFSYPAHYFDIKMANPKVVVDGSTGTLYADVTLAVTVPGSPTVTTDQPGVALASISLNGTSTTSATGVTLTVGTAIEDTTAFSFEGTSFYAVGQALDDATILLSGCAGTAAPPASGSSSTDDTTSVPLADLIPPLVYPPASATDAASSDPPATTGASLPLTGANVLGLLMGGLGAVVVGLLLSSRFRRREGVCRSLWPINEPPRDPQK